MESYYNFLMYELKDIEEELQDPSLIAHEVCLLFSLQGNSIPETFYRLYISNLSTDYVLLYNALSYFTGCGWLTVECDCSSEDKSLCDIHGIPESAFYDKGVQDAQNNTEQFRGIGNSISKMRGIIFNDC